MDQGPLVTEQIDAGAPLIAAFHEKFPVRAAFWLKDREEGEWYLYLASDQINEENTREGYREVVRYVAAHPNLWLDLLPVKVVGSDAPVAQAALAAHQQSHRPGPLRLRTQMFGGLFIDDVYIYPPPVAVAT